VLGEIAKRTLTDAGIPAEHRQGMGGTIILWQALRGGQIDAISGIHRDHCAGDPEERSSAIARQNPRFACKIWRGHDGAARFNNTYALVMRRSEAQRLGVRTISDLRKHPELKIGFTHEFLDRRDGWRPLRERYALPQQNVIA